MVYTDDIEMFYNYKFSLIHNGEIPSDWKKRIWNQLIYYKNNNKLIDNQKWYLIARKLKYLYEGQFSYPIEVNIAICYSCNKLVYSKIGCDSYYFMDNHWSTNCTRNTYCNISYKDYIELKNRSELTISIYEKKAIYRYELWISNAIKKIKRAREVCKKIKAVNIISKKWLEYMYRPGSITAMKLANHFKLLQSIREEMHNIN